MSEDKVILKKAVLALWCKGFSLPDIMHLFGLTRNQVWGYIGD